MRCLAVALLLPCVALSGWTFAQAAEHHTVLIEAEGFEDLGGWVVDQQSMDQMGSPYLMAHGLGVPVAEATTSVALPAAGTYRVLVRTRDWTAPWNVPESPGRFRVLVGGKPLGPVFGAQRADWHWQDGGTVELPAGKISLALEDLTGFNGRCDAILLTTDPALEPPNQREATARFRRKLLGLPEAAPDAGQFDLVVVGGGIAGTCAAVSAARLGLQVALVQDRPVLGGNNSSEIRVHLGGGIHLPPYPALGGVVREIAPGHGGNAGPPGNYEDDKKLAVVRAEENVRLFLNTHVFKVEKPNGRIVAVVGKDVRTNRELRFPAKLFADCTGDGTLGFLAGAEHRYGRESRAETGELLAPEEPDRQTMGTSVMWRSAETDAPCSFPDCPWALQFTEGNCQRATSGNWNWETGFRQDQVRDFEQIRDHGLRAVFGNWAFQKNRSKDKDRYANRRLEWVAYVGGKRESRRLMGDVVLRQQDVVDGREFPDACVTTTWSIDLHFPIGSDQFPGEEFRSRAEMNRIKPYPIPYRCLYSRNVENLFMAGRNISVTHVALGTVRVMRTCGMMGEVVGMAAAVCKNNDASPRQVYTDHLDDLKELLRQGVSKLPPPTPPKPPEPPEWVKTAGPNLARSARVTVSGNYDAKQYPASNINDGRISYSDNRLRWVSDKELPHTIEMAWEEPQTPSAVRIVTGQAGGSMPITPITDFVLQYHDGSNWKDVPETKVTGNEATDFGRQFPPFTAGRVRLTVTRAPGDLTRIWELELYHAPRP